MGTARPSVIENGSGSSAATILPPLLLHPPLTRLQITVPRSSRLYQPTVTDRYHSIAGIPFGTAMWPDVWGNVANSVCTPTIVRSVCNESTHPPSYSTIDAQCVCASAMSSANALADIQQRTRGNTECGPLGSSPRPARVSKQRKLI